MDILFYDTRHSLPFCARPRQPKEKFDIGSSGDMAIAGNWEDAQVRPLQETILWPVLKGLVMIEYPAVLAHVAAFAHMEKRSTSRTIAEHVLVLITNQPTTQGRDGIPRIVDEIGAVQVDVLWADVDGRVDDSLRSARFISLDSDVEAAETFRWHCYFVDRLETEKTSAMRTLEAAKRRAALYESIL